jgi:hypothetical protein
MPGPRHRKDAAPAVVAAAMIENLAPRGWMAMAMLVGTLAAEEPAAGWNIARKGGRLAASHGSTEIFGWQEKPLANPRGGEKFAGSAFVHPLRTPSGFECTTIQPADHLHHFGLWWPWKFIEVDAQKYNCWEIQEGQGAHVAKSVKTLRGSPDPLWEFGSDTIIKKAGAEPVVAIQELARVGLAIRGDATVLDISISQKPADKPVSIVEYRYSGFTWRGPETWNKDNSIMITSEGRDRDHANATEARWVVVSGPAPGGFASVLILSAAVEGAGTMEKLRVWDSSASNGAPFVNFNPVQEKPLPLDDAHPAVSERKYRVIAADHKIDAAVAGEEWKNWMKE